MNLRLGVYLGLPRILTLSINEEEGCRTRDGSSMRKILLAVAGFEEISGPIESESQEDALFPTASRREPSCQSLMLACESQFGLLPSTIRR